jgi:hypothetical protein
MKVYKKRIELRDFVVVFGAIGSALIPAEILPPSREVPLSRAVALVEPRRRIPIMSVVVSYLCASVFIRGFIA